MTSMAIRNNLIVIAKDLQIDLYDQTKHTELVVPSPTSTQEKDCISDITISSNCKHLAVITLITKKLLVYDLPQLEKYRSFDLPRSASKIRFTVNNDQILVADKSGDVLLYDLNQEDTGTKLLGHLSLLLDVLQTENKKFIITSDRDEKIRVSCYPNTYNIQSYCLGHKEFVNHIELLPHDSSCLTSTSGDGHIKFWDYVSGKLHYSIDTYKDVNDSTLKESFIKSMDTERVEVETLPIVHYAITKFDDSSSLLIVAVYGYNKLLVYRVTTDNTNFEHNLVQKLDLEGFPLAIGIEHLSLFVYDVSKSTVSIFDITEEYLGFKFVKKVKMFENIAITDDVKVNVHEAIKVLYKRKFDNVQEYQERKRLRLEKLAVQ